MTQKEQLIELIEKGDDIATEQILSETQQILKEKRRYDSAKDRLVPRQELIADYLLDNGVIVLPCKVGDKVYVLYDTICGANIMVGVVKEWRIHESPIMSAVIYIDGDICDKTSYTSVDYDLFGKTVFLTKEAAEKTLKEGKENND